MNQISPTGPLNPDFPEPDLEAAITRLAHANVLIVGDVMLDRYVWGDVERISPEAPIPILRIERQEHRLGGAGSVAARPSRKRCVGCQVSAGPQVQSMKKQGPPP